MQFGDPARVRILVPSYAYEDAVSALAAHRDAAGDVACGCPSCGQPYEEEGQKACAVCGKSLV